MSPIVNAVVAMALAVGAGGALVAAVNAESTPPPDVGAPVRLDEDEPAGSAGTPSAGGTPTPSSTPESPGDGAGHGSPGPAPGDDDGTIDDDDVDEIFPSPRTLDDDDRDDRGEDGDGGGDNGDRGETERGDD